MQHAIANTSAFVAMPDVERAPAVVLLHEWWGVNAHMQAVAQRWAAEGFLCLAVDLYHGKVAQTRAEAQAYMDALDGEGAMRDIQAAVDAARTHAGSTGKVVLSGFCMGGALAFRAAQVVTGLCGVIPFYGMCEAQAWAGVTAPILAHFATRDDWASVASAHQAQAALAALGKPMQLEVYEADHAFFNDTRPEVYNADAAALAWQRSVAFARRVVG